MPPRYLKPTTSPIEEARVLFNAAAEQDIGLDRLVEATGYSKDMLMCIRRPRDDGQGNNPPYLALKALAQVLGYEFRLVPVDAE
jgi:hypothetical protein